MYRPAHVERLAVVMAAILTLSACATMRIDSYLERGIDPGRYRSFAWGPSDTLSTGDPRLDNNRFFSERVQSAVGRHLTARGLEKGRAGASDLVVHIHASITQRLDMDAIDRQYRRCDVVDCRAMVYEAGTLMLDFVDARTNTLAWRGWAEGSLDGVIDDQQRMEETIDAAVEKILARFPRHQ